MNISYPDTTSEVYKKFISMITDKVTTAMLWMNKKGIEFCCNYVIDNHLYRLYIPQKDVLLDFEWFPVNNPYYNYIRINFNTDIVDILEQIFPETEIDTKDLDVWVIKRKIANRFFRDNGQSPVYKKDVLRLAWVKNKIIYQCMVVDESWVIANVVKKNCRIPNGTFMLLRYCNEYWGISQLQIKENLDNSYSSIMRMALGLAVDSKTPKRKVWWSPDKVVWRTDHPEDYVPFYLTEVITYNYPKENS